MSPTRMAPEAEGASCVAARRCMMSLEMDWNTCDREIPGVSGCAERQRIRLRLCQLGRLRLAWSGQRCSRHLFL